jgi:hypothetical protein
VVNDELTPDTRRTPRYKATVESLTVLYVAGWGRSGTTLLGNILNEVDGCFHAGELRFLWKYATLDSDSNSNSDCGCGLHLRDCPVWSRVLRTEIEPGVTLMARAPRIAAFLRQRFRTRHTWRLLRPALDAASASHLNVLATVYRAIQAATGARVIVDTSKIASGAAALLHLPGITPAVLHMVRDPRAVAYSWQRQKAGLGQFGALTSTWHWLRFNLAAEAVRRRLPDSSLLVRYEDFVADPQETVARVLQLAGEPAERSPMRASTVALRTNHTAQGNPDRFATGPVHIRDDDAWRAGLSAFQRAKVSIVALPLLPRYGYPLGRPGTASERRLTADHFEATADRRTLP